MLHWCTFTSSHLRFSNLDFDNFVNCIFKILVFHPFTRIFNKSLKKDSM